jgi:tRNA modification GTPase
MTALASVITAKAPAAIAVIEVFGTGALEVVSKVFKNSTGKKTSFVKGVIHTGDIIENGEIIDNVVVASTEDNSIEISCHGNPLILEMVMAALKNAGAKLTDTENFIAHKLAAQNTHNAIEIETEIQKLKAVSIAGVKALAENDLSAVVSDCLNRIDSITTEEINEKASDILAAGDTVKYLIHSCKAVLAGPPNSGKSTLLNCLAGRQKAIVTDIAGTTRDWVSATLRVGEFAIEVFDTAGLDESIMSDNLIDSESQRRSRELLNQCDIVLLVIDSKQPTTSFNLDILNQAGKKIIAIFNKSDLPGKPDQTDFKIDIEARINISAINGEGIDKLSQAIQQALVSPETTGKTFCFTPRQISIVEKLAKVDKIEATKNLLTELLKNDITNN